MEAYDKVVEFLTENEGRRMKVGIHAHNIASYARLDNWQIITNDEFGLEIEDNANTLITIVYGENGDITGFTTDSEKMNIYPETGDFELYTEHATICFELL